MTQERNTMKITPSFIEHGRWNYPTVEVEVEFDDPVDWAVHQNRFGKPERLPGELVSVAVVQAQNDDHPIVVGTVWPLRKNGTRYAKSDQVRIDLADRDPDGELPPVVHDAYRWVDSTAPVMFARLATVQEEVIGGWIRDIRASAEGTIHGEA
jgi:hypothetical protein